jgi:Uma2 family endonuclease
LNEHKNRIKDTYVEGPCDLCIEIVSPESVVRDHGEKFAEYALGGVSEYWLIDPLRNEVRFYRLDEHGIYMPQSVDKHGNYRTFALPGLVLHVPTLWLDTLPNMAQVLASVKATLEADTPKAE